MFIPIPNTVQVTYRLINAGHPCQIILYYKYTTPPITSTSLTALGVRLNIVWTNYLTYIVTTTCVIERLELRDYTTKNGLWIRRVGSSVLQGRVPGVALPDNVALLVRYHTGNERQFAKGVTHVPGCPISKWSPTGFTSAHLTAVTSAFNQFRTYPSPINWQQVLVSRFEDNAPRAVAITTPVTGISISATTASARRRMDFH